MLNTKFTHLSLRVCLAFFCLSLLPALPGLAFTQLLGSSVLAQSSNISGVLSEVRVEGTAVQGNENLIKTVIRSRPGTPASQISLESERNLILTLGLFSEVTVRLEEQPRGPVLVVRVRENPRVASVNVEGSTLGTDERWREFLDRFTVSAETTYNAIRAEEAVTGIQELYLQQGFPFEVPVTLQVRPVNAEEAVIAAQRAEADVPTLDDEDEETPEDSDEETEEAEAAPAFSVETDGDTPVVITYTISENVPVRDVTFEESDVLTEEDLQDAFLILEDSGIFTPQAFQLAVNEISEQYEEQGFRGSGVDRIETTLVNGRLNVALRERRVVALNTTAIGVDESELTLAVGDLYNVETLLEDIRRLSQGRDTDISFEPLELSSGDIRITLTAGPPGEAGEITDITIEGNDVIATEDILEILRLESGDNFTSALADEDFEAIARLYADEGYLVANVPNYNYLDGTYSQNIIELKIAGYDIVFEEEDPKSEPFIVERYLPDVGTVYNRNTFQRGALNGLRLEAYEITGQQFLPGEAADEVIIQLGVRELPTGRFSPNIQYTTGSGTSAFSANVDYGDTNFLGRAHTIGAGLSAQTSDIGFQFGGNVSYTIPWIYIDALDFQEVPTRVSASLFSNVAADQPLVAASGRATVCYGPGGVVSDEADCSESAAEDDGDRRADVGQYLQRDSGFGLSLARQIAPFTNLGVSTRLVYSSYNLEPGTDCEFNADGTLENDCDLSQDDVLELDALPQSGLSGNVSSSVTFDNRDNPNFPREGVSANAQIGVGFGNDFRPEGEEESRSYIYFPTEFGVRTYVQLSDIIGSLEDPNHVIAVKGTFGTQLGGSYPPTRRYIVGNTQDNDKLIRGYGNGSDAINPSRSYAIGTVEYRYDFGLDTVATQTVIGIVHADIGWASGISDGSAPILAGVGVGAQLNLGLGGFNLPAIRLDYSFSGDSLDGGFGVFGFRFGPVF